jgi:type II secretory pathway component PulK
MIRRAVHTVRRAFQPGYAPTRDDQRGSMLLVALGILTLLSVMAVAFAMTMNLEKKATQNYVDGVKARLIAEGALERAIEEKRREVSVKMYSDRLNEYAQTNIWLPIEVTSDVIDAGSLNDPYRPSMVGSLGRSYQDGNDRYKIKVIDTQSQFNLNIDHREELFKMMLRCLGQAIANNVKSYNATITAAATAKKLTDFQDLLFPAGNPIDRAEYPILSPEDIANGVVNQKGVDAIWDLREAKEGRRFRTKSELLECLSRSDYRLLRDFITTQSWFDPKAVTADDKSNTGNFRSGKPLGDTLLGPTASSENQEQTRRAPININLAPKPVLYAALAPVAGRRIYVHVGSSSSGIIDEGSKFADKARRLEPLQNSAGFVKDSKADASFIRAGYGAIRYLVYFPPIGYQPAGRNPVVFKRFLDDVVAAIDTRRQKLPFKSFSEWDQFVENEIAKLTNFPDFTESNSPHSPIILGSGTTGLYEVNEGTKRIVTNTPQFKEWYRRSYIGMLKSNFNPNGRFSQKNPDQPIFVEVDKANLKLLNSSLETGTTSTGGSPGGFGDSSMQTLEWCFGSKGVFEIISLGEIMQAPPGRSVEIHAQEKLRSVLQIFGQLTHTSQRDFARFGHKGLGSMPGNIGKTGFPSRDGEDVSIGNPLRMNVASYPYPWRRVIGDDKIEGQTYSKAEFGGNAAEDGAHTADGYLSLKNHNASSFGGDTTLAEDFYDVLFTDSNDMVAGPGRPAGVPDTLLELRMDFPRRTNSVSSGGFYNLATDFPGMGRDQTWERLSMLIPDVAGGRFTAATNSLRPPNNVFSQRVPTRFGIPLRPGTTDALKASYHPLWMTSNSNAGTLGERWFADHTHSDGFYVSEMTRHRYKSSLKDSVASFLAFRASAADIGVVGPSYSGPATGQPAGDPNRQYQVKRAARVVRGTDKDWAERSNTRATRGSISFWYKPDFDWVKTDHAFGRSPGPIPNPQYCGFFSSTSMAEPQFELPRIDPTTGAIKFTETDQDARKAESCRGTQMFFTRQPDGGLRVTRLYFEVAGETPAGQLTSASKEMSVIRNPYYDLPERLTGTNKQLKLVKEKQFISLEEYSQAVANYYDVTNKSITSGDVLAPTWQSPYFYPWPPKQAFLPATDAGVPGGLGPRTEIDKYLNQQNIKVARYDTYADFKEVVGSRDRNLNRRLLDMQRGNWYLLTVSWDDAANDCDIWIDGTKLVKEVVVKDLGNKYQAYDWGNGGQRDIVAPVVVLPTPPAKIPSFDKEPITIPRTNFCRLNENTNVEERNTLRDQITIGGFCRHLANSQEGYGIFKHTTSHSDVSLVANGTIDDFVVYALNTGRARVAEMDTVHQRKRFFETGMWTQRMPELASVYDSKLTPIRILGAYFEAYMPHRLFENRPQPVEYDPNAQLSVQFYTSADGGAAGTATSGGGGAGPGLVRAGDLRKWGPGALGGGGHLQFAGNMPDTAVPLSFDLKADQSLIYQVVLQSGSQPRGLRNLQPAPLRPDVTTREFISTPVFDSLTIVYQLPSRKVLIKERVFD